MSPNTHNPEQDPFIPSQRGSEQVLDAQPAEVIQATTEAVNNHELFDPLADTTEIPVVPETSPGKVRRALAAARLAIASLIR